MEDNNNNELNNEEFNEEDNIVILKDEIGKDVRFEFLDLIEYEGSNYVVLLPYDEVENGDAEEVVILKEESIPDNDEEESYVSVDDEELLNKIFEIFKDKFKDEFNFVD